ncbi:MAG: ABC transporter ATP-binding protein/permease [Oscillospiraceae bacterium]|nr:ABC transporter ATP-binding protein/permease [Oscillospiraceae bacterium]
MRDISLLNMMLDFARGIKRFFLFSVVASSIAALLGFVTPLIVGFTIDSVIGGEDTALPGPVMWLYETFAQPDNFTLSLMVCAIFAAASAILSGVFNYLSRINMAKGSETFTKRLRDQLFSHTQNLPFEWHTKNLTGDIIQRCTSDVDTIRRFVFQQLIEVLRIAILIIIAYLIMFSINVTLSLIVLVFIPITLSYSLYFYKRISHKFMACDEAEGALMVRVQENLTGVRVVRAFGREAYETERFDEKNIDYTNKWLSLGYTFGFYWGIGDIASATQLLAVIVVGSYFAATGSITFGDLLVFISYTLTLMWPVRGLGRLLTEMSKTGVSLKRIKVIFDAPAETAEPDSLKPPMDRDIVFDNVSFTYEENPVLKNISFTIKHGSTFAILGATGAGKSTVTYLLNRLYDLPDNCGTITIGGVNIKDIDRAYLRRHVGVVLQEPFLFSRSIFENIDIASRNRDLDRVREKARIAAVDDNIMAFVKGYETLVGERGVTLSGGQKQRVAIARTLMMDAPIMVFDDSMSALDMETDAKIRDSLRMDTSGATVVLISHRVSTLMTADTIMVLEDGHIAEIGSHTQLIEHNGIYRRIYDLQSGYTVE